jgi:glutaredoxin
VPAEDHTVTLYSLTTCIHCRHVREFLEKNHVPFAEHHVDIAEGEERNTLVNEVRGYNPAITFPTTVIDGATVVVGFQPGVLTRNLDL